MRKKLAKCRQMQKKSVYYKEESLGSPGSDENSTENKTAPRTEVSEVPETVEIIDEEEFVRDRREDQPEEEVVRDRLEDDQKQEPEQEIQI